MKSGKREYVLEVNGQKAGGFYVSIKEALLAREWDVITLQQASHLSFVKESYYPYIARLAEFIRELCPNSKLMIHQTWAYESESKKLLEHGFQTYDDMFAAVKACYAEAACAIDADGIIPSGEAFQYALRNGIAGIHRDTFHAKLGIGRLLLAMIWCRSITGCAIVPDRRIPLDEEISEEEYRIVTKVMEMY
jgi:hypothetical protein